MRLLNVRTRRLEEFSGDTIPLYAILSHTWGRDEVTFHDLLTEDHKKKHGYRKIEGCCQAAAEQKISYVWVDSCCIDKSSSAELSEAINSMLVWYKASEVCFIYLEDVPPGLDPFPLDSAFRKSRWWTRGWTLQELLAPQHIIYFDSTWERVFTVEMGMDLFKKVELPAKVEEVVERTDTRSQDRLHDVIQQIRYGLITEITGIPVAVLVKDLPLSQVSAACKFSWASQRMTTRIEDKAYCLMGLMGVTMPLLYGEGDKAFVRLQEAIISSSDDISLLAWGYNMTWEDVERLGHDKILARSPAAFTGYPTQNHQHSRRPPRNHSTITGHGLHVELPLLLLNASTRIWIGIVEESFHSQSSDCVLVALALRQKNAQDPDTFERARGCPVLRITSTHGHKLLLRRSASRMVYLQDGWTMSASTDPDPPRSLRSYWSLIRSSGTTGFRPPYTTEFAIFIDNLRNIGYTVSSRYPPVDHDPMILVTPKLHHWEFSGGQIKSADESPFEYLLCHGPGNNHFYFILKNSEGHTIAIRVRIKYKPPYLDSYEIALSCDLASHPSALELACTKQFGLDATRIGGKKLQWNNFVNLWSPSKTQIHITACPDQQQFSKKNAVFAQCNLIWSGGWVTDDVL